eukprot:TRINITY_DN10305_c0_g2_i1.p1 TRINITY_DN10305_c0_g2~~TRINITY_DN10305_c0_g2_i1.p1  ORF type:complete len:677 (+),score=132.34 TRINITY_DN10305_c0_g2_i1:124-2031(+)
MATFRKSMSFLLAMSAWPAFASAESRFLAPSRVTEKDVEAELLAELKDGFRQSAHKGRIVELEAALQPMFEVLPKDADGKLPHSVVRYALHRLFAQKGWFLKGVEPDGTVANESSMQNLKEWVPSALQRLIERSMGGKGLAVHDVAVLAMALEDLVHREAVGRLEALYSIHDMPKDKPISVELADQLIESFIVIFHKGGNWTADTSEAVWRRTKNFKSNHAMWPRLTEWLHSTRREVTGKVSSGSVVDFEELSRVVEEVGNRFGPYNNQDCSSMKAELLSIEDRMPGRVLLSDFYAKAIHKKWAFTEKKEYLRTLGALDESDPDKPRVIVPNYVASRPQCLEASGFYAICCPNECESLMSQLERQIGETSALPSTIVEIVSTMASNTVDAPRELPASLLSRLEWVANHHGGRVPIHGRLFAQWLHNAFPRECPFPHEAGAASAQTPDEWMQANGQKSIQASEEEMVCHVDGPCAGGAASKKAVKEEASAEDRDAAIEIPWSDAEELLVSDSSPHRAAPFQVAAEHVGALNRLLRMAVLYGAALGLAAWAKLPVTELANSKKLASSQVVGTVVLLMLPLSIVLLDCFFASMSFGHELILCGGSWGAAMMILKQMQAPASCNGAPLFGGMQSERSFA